MLKLDPVAFSDDLTVIAITERLPIIRGIQPGGLDWLCSTCDAAIMVNIPHGQIWDIAFKCFCGQLSIAPARTPGTSFPIQPAIMPAGTYKIDGILDLPGPLVMISERDYERRLHEVGPKVYTSYTLPEQLVAPFELTSDSLNSLLIRLRAVIGELFNSLQATDARGQASPTPSKKRHRLMMLVSSVNTALQNIQNDIPTLLRDVINIGELHRELPLLEAWRNEPYFEKIVRSIKNVEDYPHAVTTLALAS